MSSHDDQLIKILQDNTSVKPLTESLNALASVIKQSGLNGSLYPFGSFCNGFPVDLSDLDVVFVTEMNLSQVEVLRMIDKQIQKSKNVPKLKTNVRILHARIPILKIKDETNQVDIDLSINNINGIVNSKLLLEYSKLHPNIAILGKLLKLWGKKQGIISQSGLSSYALILAMIYYLQQKHHIPCLQDVEYNRNQLSEFEHLELNPFFKLACHFKPLDDIPLTQLFEGFFSFYQSEGEFSQSFQFISINGHNEHATHKVNTLPILDPINRRHDPSQKFKNQTKYYQKLFKQAVTLIQRNDLETLFHLKRHKEKQIQINQVVELSDDALHLNIQQKENIKLTFEKMRKYIETNFNQSKLELIGNQNESYGIVQCDIDCNLITQEDVQTIREFLQEEKTYNVYKVEQEEFIVLKDQEFYVKIHLTINFQLSHQIHDLLQQQSKLHPKVEQLFRILRYWSLEQMPLCKLSQSKFSYFHFMMIYFLQQKYGIQNIDAQKLNETSILEMFTQFLAYYNGEFQQQRLCLAINGIQSKNDEENILVILNPFSESPQVLLKLQVYDQIQLYFSKESLIKCLYKLARIKNAPTYQNPVKESPAKHFKKHSNNEKLEKKEKKEKNEKKEKKEKNRKKSRKESQAKKNEKQHLLQKKGQQEWTSNIKSKKTPSIPQDQLYVPKFEHQE